jgi:hypothetical protein
MQLLENAEVIRWCYESITEVSLINTKDKDKLVQPNENEKRWGNSIVGGGGGSQWTTKLCQDVVMEALKKLGRKNVHRAVSTRSSVRDKGYQPDLECDEYVYEVKGRNWSTTGTAGEKILGVPLKYGELPRLYKKPLQIILVGYQEYEARNGFAFGDLLNKNDQTKELQESLAFYKEHSIEYVAFTDILKKIGIEDGYWKRQ